MSQSFEIGNIVKIGFVGGLKVLEKIATPGDYRPDFYVLLSSKGVYYSFQPHYGLSRRVSLADARDWR